MALGDFDLMTSSPTMNEIDLSGGMGFDFTSPGAPASGMSMADIKGLGMLGSAVGTYMQGIEQKQAYDYNAALVRRSLSCF